MKEHPVFKYARLLIRTILKGVMAAATVILLLMAYNIYNGYNSKAGIDPIPSILLVAIPLVALGLAAYAHQKLKIN